MMRKNQYIAAVSAMGMLLSLVTDLVKYLREAGLTIAEIGECFAALASKKGVGALKRIAEEMVAEYRRQNPKFLREEIDTDVDSQLAFSDATIESHTREGKVVYEKRTDGTYRNGKKIGLYRSSRQMNGKSVQGHELRTEVDGQPVLSASDLDFFKAHPEFFPEEWKKDENGNTLHIFFWGTVYRYADDNLFVRCLCWDGLGLSEFYDWLDHYWSSDDPAAVTEKPGNVV